MDISGEMMMAPEQLKQLDEDERVIAGATPGPWERFGYIGHAGGLRSVRSASLSRRNDFLVCDCNAGNHEQRPLDAAFIARSRTRLPALVAQVREMQGEIDAAKRTLANLHEIAGHASSYGNEYGDVDMLIKSVIAAAVAAQQEPKP